LLTAWHFTGERPGVEDLALLALTSVLSGIIVGAVSSAVVFLGHVGADERK
jgi:hypothetical protein